MRAPFSPLSFFSPRSVHNVAYRLALLISVGGLVLLAMAGPGDDLQTTLGAMGLVGAGLLVGLGALLRFLGYIEEGAADRDGSP
ncbi:hypothetical protein SRU_0048 [Salinibacter ruber DSM 13855]|uniref:Uncharacterized protein n=1 Tax=Salinibacter ruber (strain DSM 13855 / M31) TaxID=309807 RepID=Q2S6H8_SALRD|nr:hypothetical protein SRU_0048 [Salinibacter ruber DSM 13855]